MTNTPLFHIRCLIEGIQPPIWRSLQVPGWMTFHQLHTVLAASMQWQDGPGYQMEIGSHVLRHDQAEPGFDSHQWRIQDWFQPGLRFICRHPLGWRLSVQVAGLAEQESGRSYPRCIGGERASPPESLEGPAGYAKLLKNPKQRGLWSPERFDLDAINQVLSDCSIGLKPIRSHKREIPPEILTVGGPGTFLKESDVQFDLYAYYQELETAYWGEAEPETMKEALSSLKREDLIGLCMVYGLAVEPGTRRLAMEENLMKQLPEAIRLQLPYLDDRQYGLLRQVVDSPEGMVRFARAEVLFSPYELYYFRDRLLLYPRTRGGFPELYMLPEVREALRIDAMQSLSRTQLQNTNRRRIMAGMFQYYGVLSMEELQVLLSDLLGETVDLDTIIVDVQELQDFNDAVTIGETLVMHTALDIEKAEEVWFRQGLYPDLPYRKLSLETLDLAGDWMFVEATHEAEILISFLESRYGLNTGAAEGVAWELMHRFRWGEPLEQTLALAGQTVMHPDTAAEKRFLELAADLWLHAPAWRYKGWSPAEIRTMELHPERGMTWLSPDPDDYEEAIRIVSEGMSSGNGPFEMGKAGIGVESAPPSVPDEKDAAEAEAANFPPQDAHDAVPLAPGAIAGTHDPHETGMARGGRVLSFPTGPRKPKHH